jgi:hypothetical protein
LVEAHWQQLICSSFLAKLLGSSLMADFIGSQLLAATHWQELFAAACLQQQLTNSSLFIADNWQQPVGSR